MALENNQQLITSGSILWLARIDPITALVGLFRDVGTIQVANPNTQSNSISLFDSRGGTRIQVARRTTEFTESYEVTCANMTPENLAFTFGAKAVEDYSQAASPITATHDIGPDAIIPLHDSSGNYYYDLGVVTIATWVLGTDYLYDATLAKLGCIKTLNTANTVVGTKSITFTPNALTTAKRVFNPHTAGVAKCEAKIFWTADGYDYILVRDSLQVEVTPAVPEFRDTDFSNMRFTLNVVSNNTNATRPAGRVVFARGGLPKFSF
jgi:hypothetical protein